MRGMSSLLALAFVFGATVGAARAQDGTSGAVIRAGFFRGADFQNGPNKTHLEGFEIGADVPLSRRHTGNFVVCFSPTVTFGGSNRHGADTDGNIYHLLVSARFSPARSRAYAGVGLGYGFTQARIHEFRNVSGLAVGYTVGYNFRPSRPGQAAPLAEITYHNGAHSQLRGLSVDVGARF